MSINGLTIDVCILPVSAFWWVDVIWV